MAEYKQPWTTVFKKIIQFRWGRPKIKRHKNGAQPGACQEKLNKLRAVVQHNRYAIALFDSQRLQPTTGPIGPLIQLSA
jgi:hypothetical protein